MDRMASEKKDIRVQVKKTRLFWIGMAVLGVIALPTMVVALTQGNWWLAIPCMVLVVFNFYGQPIAWVMLAKKIALKNYYVAIAIDGITDISLLAASFGRKEKYVMRQINTLISKGYLRGCVLDNQNKRLLDYKGKPIESSTSRTHCPSCGAAIITDDKNCAYCNTKLA